MYPVRKIIVFIFLSQKLGDSVQWTPVGSPYLFQNYDSRQLSIMRPPSISSVGAKTPQILPNVDFKKPKTQIFYKTTFLPAQPPEYQFRYKIHDPKAENYQEKSEIRVGDSVQGFYSVREPNGYVRLVKYVSDEKGFQTQVSHHFTDDNEGGYLFKMTRHVT